MLKDFIAWLLDDSAGSIVHLVSIRYVLFAPFSPDSLAMRIALMKMLTIFFIS
jgi:hypothetical protein